MARETAAILASFLKPLRECKTGPFSVPTSPQAPFWWHSTTAVPAEPTHPSLVTSEPSLSFFFFPSGLGLGLSAGPGLHWGRGLRRHPLLSCSVAHFRTRSQLNMPLSAISQAGDSARLWFHGVGNPWKQPCIFSLAPSPFFPELPLVLTL